MIPIEYIENKIEELSKSESMYVRYDVLALKKLLEDFRADQEKEDNG